MASDIQPRNIAPTTILPPLARISQFSPAQITFVLNCLRELYWPSLSPQRVDPLLLPQRIGLHKGLRVKRSIQDESIPDSGYASAEEEEYYDETVDSALEQENNDFDVNVLRADAFERKFAITWLTGFIARSDIWLSLSISEDEDERYGLMDDVSSLLSAFAGDDKVEEALTRCFSFPLPNATGVIQVELNDAPLSTEDHTSVGLQSWASSIVLAERMCARPVEFGIPPALGCGDGKLRILELGAGTGLLSIVAAKLFHNGPTNVMADVVATDYHPDVLSNLTANIRTNFPYTPTPIGVHSLNWEYPSFSSPLDTPFDVILAADVVYHPDHARWIKGCVEIYLSRPGPGVAGGVFWLIIPLRSTGRHEGMGDTVDEVFEDVIAYRGCEGDGEWKLAVLKREDVGRHEGVGRADEGGYKLFKIGWVKG